MTRGTTVHVPQRQQMEHTQAAATVEPVAGAGVDCADCRRDLRRTGDRSHGSPLFISTPTPTRSPGHLRVAGGEPVRRGKTDQAEETYRQAIGIDPRGRPSTSPWRAFRSSTETPRRQPARPRGALLIDPTRPRPTPRMPGHSISRAVRVRKGARGDRKVSPNRSQLGAVSGVPGGDP